VEKGEGLVVAPGVWAVEGVLRPPARRAGRFPLRAVSGQQDRRLRVVVQAAAGRLRSCLGREAGHMLGLPNSAIPSVGAVSRSFRVAPNTNEKPIHAELVLDCCKGTSYTNIIRISIRSFSARMEVLCHENSQDAA